MNDHVIFQLTVNPIEEVRVFSWGDTFHITGYENTDEERYEIDYTQGIPMVDHEDLMVRVYRTEDDADNNVNWLTDHNILDHISVHEIDPEHVVIEIEWDEIDLSDLFGDHQDVTLYARLVATQDDET